MTERKDHIMDVAQQMYEDARSSDHKAYPEWRDAPDDLVQQFYDQAEHYLNEETSP